MYQRLAVRPVLQLPRRRRRWRPRRRRAPGRARRLRVLEIGGGTGGTTAPGAAAAGRRAASSTPSPTSRRCSWPAPARRSAPTPASSFATLDIETDPAAQGFAAHGYDVVSPPTCCTPPPTCAAPSPTWPDLLAPGGLLVLLEMTKPQRFIDISFGLTPGWWKFTDHDVRPDYLLLDRAGWLQFLADAGFGEPAAAPSLGGRRRRRPVAADAGRGPGARGRRRRRAAADRRSWLVLADERRRRRRRWPSSLGRRRRSRHRGHGRRRVPPHGDASATSSIRPQPEHAGPPRGRGAGRRVGRRRAPVEPRRAGGHARAHAGPAHRQRAVAGAGARSPAARRRKLWLVTRGAQAVARRRARPDPGARCGASAGSSPSSTRSCAAPASTSTRRPAADAAPRPARGAARRRRRGPGRPPRAARRSVARLVPCPEAAGAVGAGASRCGWSSPRSGVLDEHRAPAASPAGRPGPARSRSASTPPGSTSAT